MNSPDIVRLGEIADFRNGVNFSRHDEGSGIPIVKVKDFGALHFIPEAGFDELDQKRINVSSEQLLQPRDILIMRSNGNRELVGRSLIFRGSKRPVTFSGFCIRARIDQSRAVPEFIHYWLRSPLTRAKFSQEGTGTGINNLSQGLLSALEITLPSLQQQALTAEVLGALDDKIELNRRMNETLEAMAQAIFRDWFVDFGPTRRKLAGIADPIEIMGGLVQDPARAAKLAALFPAALGDNGLPEGWSQAVWGAIATLEYGKRLVDYRESIGTVPVYGTNGQIGWCAEAMTAEASVIIGRKGAYRGVHYASEPCSVIDTAFYLKLNGQLSTRWAYLEVLRNDINAMDSGSAIPSTSRTDFYQLPVNVPSDWVLEAFDALLGPSWELQRKHLEQNATLSTMRDLLLPKLMSGEIRLRDAEALAEGAT